MSREYATNEVKEKFINHVNLLIEEWAGKKNRTDMEKCTGVALSILSMLDESSELPVFIVAPNLHKEDLEYLKSKEEDWYLEINFTANICNSSGSLHD